MRCPEECSNGSARQARELRRSPYSDHMASGVFGGGLIFVVAALLWVAVLVPSWVRRREFRTAEQNALRLQRTLRVLAETAEVPTEVRVEATAREALAQERLLRTAQRQQDAERKAELSEARTKQIHAEMRAQQMKRKQAALARSAKLRRPVVRRARSLAALVLVLAFAATLVGAGTLIAGLGPALLLSAVAAVTVALGVLVLLAPGRVRHVEIDAERIAPSPEARVAAPAATVETVDRGAQKHAAAQAAAAARIERARAMARARAEGASAAGAGGSSPMKNQPESILLERGHEAVPKVDKTEKPSAPAVPAASRPASAQARALAAEIAASERLRKMGVVGDTSDGALDLDAVLRNRRAG